MLASTEPNPRVLVELRAVPTGAELDRVGWTAEIAALPVDLLREEKTPLIVTSYTFAALKRRTRHTQRVLLWRRGLAASRLDSFRASCDVAVPAIVREVSDRDVSRAHSFAQADGPYLHPDQSRNATAAPWI